MGAKSIKKLTSGHSNWFTSALASAALALGLATSTGASAALLGVELGLPKANFNNTGVVNYNAASDEFIVSNTVTLSVLFPPGTPRFVFPSANDGQTVAINIRVDSAGNLTGGLPGGDDLLVTGAVDTTGDSVLDANGILLTGEIVAFGFSDSGGPTDFFDFRFVVTGGALAPLYGGLDNDIGVVLTSEGSSFTGGFSSNFNGDAKGNVGPIGITIEKFTNGYDADDANGSPVPTPPNGPGFPNDVGGTQVPVVAIGDDVTWTYVVTNTSGETLENVVVTDSQNGLVTCPKMVLTAGESMTCTVMGTADDLSMAPNTVLGCDGQGAGTPRPTYENEGVVNGTGQASGIMVSGDDLSHYCNPAPSILLEKLTNNKDADTRDQSSTSYPPPGFDPTIPQINDTFPITWTYLVTNNGNVTLTNVEVVDDAGTPGDNSDDFCTPNAGCMAAMPVISCPMTTLEPNEMMTCTASGTAVDLSDPMVTTVPGLCGTFPNTPLYENMGKARGEHQQGQFVEDEDASHYCNPPAPAILLEKLTNGFDADTLNEMNTSFGPNGTPSIIPGADVTWTYLVTNTGNTDLIDITLRDDAGSIGVLGDDFCTPGEGCLSELISCVWPGPVGQLLKGEMMTCETLLMSATAHDLTTFTPVFDGICGGDPAKLYQNGAKVIGIDPNNNMVMDDDPSHYCNPPGDCELEVDKTCLVIPPPSSNPGVGSCQKPIDVLKLEYAGSKTINGVTWYSGDVDPGEVIRSATAGEVATLNGGGVVEFDGFETNNSPNDVHIVTSFTDGTSETSQFHLSCSDPEMKLPEHCGTVIGDGKSDALPNGKFWTFRGAVRLDGVGLICPLPPAGPAFPTQTACEFTPLVSAASCDDIKPITALTMIWNGADNVTIQGPGGQVISDIDNGDVVTFDAGGFGNDVELTLSGGATGTSTFHVSCSDDDMDGPEDCGTPQGNGKNDDAGFNNQWALGGMTGEDGVIDCGGILGSSGAEVSYGIAVNNLNNEAVDVTISDPLLGLNVMQNIPANSTFELITDPQLIVPDGSNVFVNVVNVTGTTASGASCDASAMASLTRKPPPPAPVSCSDIKPIAKLTMVWNGPGPVDITIDDTGQLFEGVQNNNQITFDTLGIGNDVDVTISGAVNANATFHVSCSDQGMNGSEDCGTNQGNGKNNDGGLNNQFLLDGMTGEGSNGAFACNLNNTGVVDPTAGGGGPGGGGNVTGASSLELSDDKVKWELTNNGNQDVLVTRVVVSWPSQHEMLNKFKLAGDFAKDVDDTSSPTAVPDEKAFESDPDKRTLEAGKDEDLVIEFEEKYDNNSESDYTITVEFDNGQTLSFP